ncbi:hypothetical protein Rsub_12262 [Raphidocelis subcapitata]|uniref:Cyclin N-terminal domain-containing protein n=1 Tax=Raphidocelis subcapitata TaxID=307507 RepID=A0A2V0PNC6_9CHLO|nr:hypothetical protein Rsub_12262 [Raphidocelis subcapitata]|eukprot:GBF99430.1 hypothetical protein Rsub_12262 [Raphidocelis subcapitata]
MSAAAAAAAAAAGPSAGRATASDYPRFDPLPARQLEESSPSRAHGIDWKTELSYRKVTSGLVYSTACGQSFLKLTDFTAARAVTLFNRFYARCSFHTIDRWHIAPACILLASKIDNSPRTARDVATAFFVARCEKKHQHLIQRVYDPAWVAAQVALVVEAERAVLFALNFDLLVDIPGSWILPALRALGLPLPQQGREPRGASEAAALDLVRKTYSLLAAVHSSRDAVLLHVTHAAADVGKAALLMTVMLTDYPLPLPAGSCFADHVGSPAGTLAEICERLRGCFAADTPGSKITAEAARARALLRAAAPPAPAAAPAAADGGGGAAGGEPAAARPQGGGSEAAAAAADAAVAAAAAEAAPLADSPPTAHDSASSHAATAGTALASRKRGREDGGSGGGGSGAAAEGGAPAAKQQHLQQQQQQQQQQQTRAV